MVLQAIPQTTKDARPILAGLAALALVATVLVLDQTIYDAAPPDIPQDMVPVALPDTARKIFVKTHETTVEEWNRCFKNSGCHLELRKPAGDPSGTYPATNISWMDVQEYLRWLRKETGLRYRLPTGGEWIAIAGKLGPAPKPALFDDPAMRWASGYVTEESSDRTLRRSGSFSLSQDGISDLDGNVWEWTSECYDGDVHGPDDDPCAAFFAMGEHASIISFLVRDPVRGGCAVGVPPAHLGLRLVLDESANS